MRGVDGDTHALASALALPFDLPAAREAARHLLESPRCDELLDRLYPLLIWHKCWGHALAHIERAGGDLERLSLSVARFLDSFPVRGRRLWTLEGAALDDRFSLAVWARLIERHKRLLREATADVLDRCDGDIALLSGRALEALYPEYAERTELDSDLHVVGLESGMRLMRELVGRGFAVRFVRARASPRTGRVVCEAGLERFEHGHSVTLELEIEGALEIEGELEMDAAPSGRRFVEARWRGRSVKVPAPEELLLGLCERCRSQRSLQQVSVNDAVIILRRQARTLDWEAIVSRARAAGLTLHLRLLLEKARAIGSDELVGPHPPGLDEPTRRERLLLSWARSLELDRPRDPAAMSTGGLGGRLLRHLTRRGTAEARDRPGPVGASLERLVYRVQLRVARALPTRLDGLTRWMSGLRPHLGSLCELRESPLDPLASFCLAGTRSRSTTRRKAVTEARLEEIAADIPGPGSAPHDCYRFEYQRGRG